jgi:hypothetical protein
MFSAPKHEGGSETPGIEETVLVESRREHLHRPGSDVGTESPVRLTPATAPVAQQQPTTHTGVEPITAASSAVPTERSDATPVASTAGDERPGFEETETLVARSYTPLIAGDFPASDPSRISPNRALATAPAFSPPKQSRENLPQHSQASSHAPDEIRIHIGLIEVTAVHPAPTPSAPAKRPRRAPSLDEYLRSRDSRPS